MRYDEFKKCLKVAGLSVKELAELLDMQPNSITNYRARVSVPRHLEVVASLLAALESNGIDRSTVLPPRRPV